MILYVVEETVLASGPRGPAPGTVQYVVLGDEDPAPRYGQHSDREMALAIARAVPGVTEVVEGEMPPMIR